MTGGRTLLATTCPSLNFILNPAGDMPIIPGYSRPDLDPSKSGLMTNTRHSEDDLGWCNATLELKVSAAAGGYSIYCSPVVS